MKKVKLIAAVLTVLFAVTSCKKYPNGPSISFETRKARVANTWKMEAVTVNGADITSAYTNISYTETYTKTGDYSYGSNLGSGSGKWAFENKDTQIKRNGVSGQSSVDLTILRLKEKSFWYKFVDGKDTYEFHLIPK